MKKPPPPWSREDAAKHLGISTRTLDRRIEDGTVQVIRLGRRVLIPHAEVNRLAGYNTQRKGTS